MNYAIGDIQGCFDKLQELLELIQFNPDQDTLWFTGDLVNRGPQSLDTLRFIKQLGKKHHTVLGNHDLHLLARADNAHPGWEEDTINDILTAPDRNELITWLRQQPLLYHDETLGFTLVHAGLAPNWDLKKAKALAHEVEMVLQSDEDHRVEFFHHMYGNEPDYWDDGLRGMERLRCITNFFTRLRFCHPDGRMELSHKGKIDSTELLPWFNIPGRLNQSLTILFGHWAALAGVTNTPHTFALDTGCIWGYSLSALRLEDEKWFRVSCHQDAPRLP